MHLVPPFFLSGEARFREIYQYLTCLLTLWSKVRLEKLTGSQSVKKFPAFYGTRRFITAFTRARHLSLSWASLIQSLTPTGSEIALIDSALSMTTFFYSNLSNFRSIGVQGNGREHLSFILTVLKLLQTEWQWNTVRPSSHELRHTAPRHDCFQVHQDTQSLRGNRIHAQQ